MYQYVTINNTSEDTHCGYRSIDSRVGKQDHSPQGLCPEISQNCALNFKNKSKDKQTKTKTQGLSHNQNQCLYPVL